GAVLSATTCAADRCLAALTTLGRPGLPALPAMVGEAAAGSAAESGCGGAWGGAEALVAVCSAAGDSDTQTTVPGKPVTLRIHATQRRVSTTRRPTRAATGGSQPVNAARPGGSVGS